MQDLQQTDVQEEIAELCARCGLELTGPGDYLCTGCRNDETQASIDYADEQYEYHTVGAF